MSVATVTNIRYDLRLALSSSFKPPYFPDVFTADVSLTLTKAKNKAPSAVKTSIDSITTSPLAG